MSMMYADGDGDSKIIGSDVQMQIAENSLNGYDSTNVLSSSDEHTEKIPSDIQECVISGESSHTANSVTECSVEWNLSQYGVEDVSTLSKAQIEVLRLQQIENKRKQEEEDGKLLQFLSKKDGDIDQRDDGSDSITPALREDNASTPAMNRPLTWEEKEAIRESDADFAAQLALQQDASVDAFFSFGNASQDHNMSMSSSGDISKEADDDGFPKYNESDYEPAVPRKHEGTTNSANGNPLNFTNNGMGYDSFPPLPSASAQQTPETNNMRKPQQGFLQGFSFGGLFGSNDVSGNEVSTENGDDITRADTNEKVFFSAEEDNVLVEGFMCPHCLCDCESPESLLEHFNAAHGEAEAGGDTHSIEIPDPKVPSTQQDFRQDDNLGRNGKLNSDDATTAWAIAGQTMGVESIDIDGSDTSEASTATSLNKVHKLPDVSSAGPGELFDKMPGGRHMYCERCFVHKMHIEDVYCLNCGQPHTNRMASISAHLKLRVSAYGFGLGFKDRHVHKVQPGSTSEVSGLRVGDTITEVNGVDVKDTADLNVLKMIKESKGTLYLTVTRLEKAPPASEYSNRDDDITRDEEQIFHSPRDERPYSSRLEFEDTGESGSEGGAPLDLQQSQATSLGSIGLETHTEEGESRTVSRSNSQEASRMNSGTDVQATVKAEHLLEDDSGVSQSIRDSNYVKALRARIASCEAELEEKEEFINALESQKQKAEEELQAVMRSDESVLIEQDPQSPISPIPGSAETEGTLFHLCKTLKRHVEATRNVASPLAGLIDDLPRRVASVVTSKVELQHAAEEQARLSQEINRDMLSAAEQLALSRSDGRVGAASDAAELNEKSLSATTNQVMCNVEMLQKTALLAEHHVQKLIKLLKDVPALCRTPVE